MLLCSPYSWRGEGLYRNPVANHCCSRATKITMLSIFTHSILDFPCGCSQSYQGIPERVILLNPCRPKEGKCNCLLSVKISYEFMSGLLYNIVHPPYQLLVQQPCEVDAIMSILQNPKWKLMEV